MDPLIYTWYVRTPFAVRAVKITEDNIDAIAQLIGEIKTQDGERYIKVDRRIIPNVGRARVGWYLTVLGDNLRCYSPKIFKEQFIDMPEGNSVRFGFVRDVEGEEMDTAVLSDFPDAVELPQPEFSITEHHSWPVEALPEPPQM